MMNSRQITFGLTLVAALCILKADAANKNKPLSEAQKDEVWEIVSLIVDESVENITKDKFQAISDCMKKEEWYNPEITDCVPCEKCNTQYGCNMHCQAIFKAQELGRKIMAEKEDEMSMLDKNTQELWAAFAAVLALALLTLFGLLHLCCQKKIMADEHRRAVVALLGQIKSLKDDLNDHINRVSTQAPTGDLARKQNGYGEAEPFITQEEEDDSGVSGSEDTLLNQDSGV